MITIDFSFAAVNILLKKVLEEGINHLVFITYRLSIATIFIGPIGYFKERLVPSIPWFSSCHFLGGDEVFDIVNMQIDQIAKMNDFELKIVKLVS